LSRRRASAACEAESTDAGPAGLRLDKWLWAARVYKTRALAAEAADLGRIKVNGIAAKPARDLRLGALVDVRDGGRTRTVKVLALSAQRGPAVVAQTLYEETPESMAARDQAQRARRDGVEPAWTLLQGRPTKRDRRDLVQWQRWSASLDSEG
jgi:ribosome-associated heat shock protein Hsp15